MSAFAIRTQPALETSYLGASENDLSRHEDKKYDFRFDHTINKPRKKLQRDQLVDQGCARFKTTYLWLITTKLSVAVCKTLKTNRKLDVAAADDVLNLEFRELGIKAKLLDNARVLARRQARVVFTLRTSHDHLP
jgi:hypothetical protein